MPKLEKRHGLIVGAAFASLLLGLLLLLFTSSGRLFLQTFWGPRWHVRQAVRLDETRAFVIEQLIPKAGERSYLRYLTMNLETGQILRAMTFEGTPTQGALEGYAKDRVWLSDSLHGAHVRRAEDLADLGPLDDKTPKSKPATPFLSAPVLDSYKRAAFVAEGGKRVQLAAPSSFLIKHFEAGQVASLTRAEESGRVVWSVRVSALLPETPFDCNARFDISRVYKVKTGLALFVECVEGEAKRASNYMVLVDAKDASVKLLRPF